MTQANLSYNGDGIKITDGSADYDFTLLGGRYILVAKATWGGGSLSIAALAADGSSYVIVKNIAGAAMTLTADGSMAADLPAGSYRADFTTATAAYVTLTPAPARR